MPAVCQTVECQRPGRKISRLLLNCHSQLVRCGRTAGFDGVVANHQRNRRLLTRGKDIGGGARNDPAINDRMRSGAVLRVQGIHCFQQIFGRHLAQKFNSALPGWNFHLSRELYSGLFCWGTGMQQSMHRRSALHNRLLRQFPCQGGHHQTRIQRTRGLAKDSDVMRVAAELCNIGDYPAKGENLVHQAVIT